MTSQDAVEDAQRMKRDLLEKLEQLAQDLPPNTLDELIDELGGPDNVAEVRIFIETFFLGPPVIWCAPYLKQCMPF